MVCEVLKASPKSTTKGETSEFTLIFKTSHTHFWHLNEIVVLTSNPRYDLTGNKLLVFNKPPGCGGDTTHCQLGGWCETVTMTVIWMLDIMWAMPPISANQPPGTFISPNFQNLPNIDRHCSYQWFANILSSENPQTLSLLTNRNNHYRVYLSVCLHVTHLSSFSIPPFSLSNFSLASAFLRWHFLPSAGRGWAALTAPTQISETIWGNGNQLIIATRQQF